MYLYFSACPNAFGHPDIVASDMCLYVEQSELATYDEAVQICQFQGGRLPIVDTQNNTFITKIMSGTLYQVIIHVQYTFNASYISPIL